MQKNNATIVKAIRLEVREQLHIQDTGQNQTIRVEQTRQVQQGQSNGNDDSKGQNRVTEQPVSPGQQKVRTTATTAPALETDDKGGGNSGTGNSASNDDGNSNNGNSGSGKNH